MKTAENYQFPKVSLDEFIAMDTKVNHSMESKTTDDMENYDHFRKWFPVCAKWFINILMVDKTEPLNGLTPFNLHTSF